MEDKSVYIIEHDGIHEPDKNGKILEFDSFISALKYVLDIEEGEGSVSFKMYEYYVHDYRRWKVITSSGYEYNVLECIKLNDGLYEEVEIVDHRSECFM